MKSPLLALVTLSLLVSALAPATAFAQEDPEVTVQGDHEVRGEVLVHISADAARKLVDDPLRVSVIEGGTAQMKVVSQDACKTIMTEISHPVASVGYLSRTCPTAKGTRTELVESADLESFHSEWQVEEVEGGTLLRYLVRTIPRIPVPQFIVDKQSRGSVQRLLKRVKAHLEAGN